MWFARVKAVLPYIYFLLFTLSDDELCFFFIVGKKYTSDESGGWKCYSSALRVYLIAMFIYLWIIIMFPWHRYCLFFASYFSSLFWGFFCYCYYSESYTAQTLIFFDNKKIMSAISFKLMQVHRTCVPRASALEIIIIDESTCRTLHKNMLLCIVTVRLDGNNKIILAKTH